MRCINLKTGIIERLALTNDSGLSSLMDPIDITATNDGRLLATYIAESCIRSLSVDTGDIRLIAGTGQPGYSGDGGPAYKAQLNFPVSTTTDLYGNIYIADANNFVVRRVDHQTAVITTIAGTGERGYAGDGGPAIGAQLSELGDICLDSNGCLIIADLENSVIRRIDRLTGIITTVVGTGTSGNLGDGEIATLAELRYPNAVVVDQTGDLYISEAPSHVIRCVDHRTGNIATIAGRGIPGYSGDGGPASEAIISQVTDLALDGQGHLYLADTGNSVIRRIDAASGVITTIAGTGIKGDQGDGAPATQAQLSCPVAVEADGKGHLFIAEVT